MERPLESRPCGAGLSQVESRGWSTYNSLQVKVTKRFSRSFMLLSSYTYGKVLDIASDAESGTLNAWNFNQDRGPATFDIEHLWTTSWIYELPFGKGKRFGAGWNTLAGMADRWNSVLAHRIAPYRFPADRLAVDRHRQQAGPDCHPERWRIRPPITV